ncbi:hypothetical protein CYMTET_36275, partial [Cymbomonas tetramitiformis]
MAETPTKHAVKWILQKILHCKKYAKIPASDLGKTLNELDPSLLDSEPILESLLGVRGLQELNKKDGFSCDRLRQLEDLLPFSQRNEKTSKADLKLRTQLVLEPLLRPTFSEADLEQFKQKLQEFFPPEFSDIHGFAERRDELITITDATDVTSAVAKFQQRSTSEIQEVQALATVLLLQADEQLKERLGLPFFVTLEKQISHFNAYPTGGTFGAVPGERDQSEAAAGGTFGAVPGERDQSEAAGALGRMESTKDCGKQAGPSHQTAPASLAQPSHATVQQQEDAVGTAPLAPNRTMRSLFVADAALSRGQSGGALGARGACKVAQASTSIAQRGTGELPQAVAATDSPAPHPRSSPAPHPRSSPASPTQHTRPHRHTSPAPHRPHPAEDPLRVLGHKTAELPQPVQQPPQTLHRTAPSPSQPLRSPLQNKTPPPSWPKPVSKPTCEQRPQHIAQQTEELSQRASHPPPRQPSNQPTRSPRQQASRPPPPHYPQQPSRKPPQPPPEHSSRQPPQQPSRTPPQQRSHPPPRQPSQQQQQQQAQQQAQAQRVQDGPSPEEAMQAQCELIAALSALAAGSQQALLRFDDAALGSILRQSITTALRCAQVRVSSDPSLSAPTAASPAPGSVPPASAPESPAPSSRPGVRRPPATASCFPVPSASPAQDPSSAFDLPRAFTVPRRGHPDETPASHRGPAMGPSDGTGAPHQHQAAAALENSWADLRSVAARIMKSSLPAKKAALWDDSVRMAAGSQAGWAENRRSAPSPSRQRPASRYSAYEEGQSDETDVEHEDDEEYLAEEEDAISEEEEYLAEEEEEREYLEELEGESEDDGEDGDEEEAEAEAEAEAEEVEADDTSYGMGVSGRVTMGERKRTRDHGSPCESPAANRVESTGLSGRQRSTPQRHAAKRARSIIRECDLGDGDESNCEDGSARNDSSITNDGGGGDGDDGERSVEKAGCTEVLLAGQGDADLTDGNEDSCTVCKDGAELVIGVNIKLVSSTYIEARSMIVARQLRRASALALLWLLYQPLQLSLAKQIYSREAIKKAEKLTEAGKKLHPVLESQQGISLSKGSKTTANTHADVPMANTGNVAVYADTTTVAPAPLPSTCDPESIFLAIPREAGRLHAIVLALRCQ